MTPDGKQAVSASDDDTLKVWDLERGKCITSFTGDAPFSSCDLSPDRVTFVAGDVVGGVHFLRLEEPTSRGSRNE